MQHRSLSDLPFTEQDKVFFLEWLAYKLWVIIEETSGDPDYYHKSYDPLEIEIDPRNGQITAHSYVFDFEDGGRHQPMESLGQLEELLVKESIKKIKSQKLEDYILSQGDK